MTEETRHFDRRAWEWNTLARLHDRLSAEGITAYERGEYGLARAFQREAQLALQLLHRLTRRRVGR